MVGYFSSLEGRWIGISDDLAQTKILCDLRWWSCRAKMAYGRRGAFRRLPPLGEHRMERKVMRQFPKSAELNVAQNQLCIYFCFKHKLELRQIQRLTWLWLIHPFKDKFTIWDGHNPSFYNYHSWDPMKLMFVLLPALFFSFWNGEKGETGWRCLMLLLQNAKIVWVTGGSYHGY